MRGAARTKSTITENARSINKEEWLKKMDNTSIDKQFLDSVVMDYLVKEGFQDVAEIFSQETSTPLPPDSISFQPIKVAVEKGNVGEAICRTNDIDPSILETHHELFCHLQQLQVITMINNGNIDAALDMAQNELRYRAEEDPSFLPELEKTICLLAFHDKTDSPFHYLNSPLHRIKIAHELNSVLLNSHGIEGDSKLHHVLKFIDWCERELTSLSIPHAKMTDVIKGNIEFPPL
ncbi:hypothetical protein LOD99_268 [Oopsacas minuta]|uniref:CTLH domain-containing protein n=1 Tax=Oopsacas minuta TaxID=111878 RepID=A0AAV7K8J9_9METZ|nr:hypothetical protein LOD99_268 [Oopsacas minuta]